MAGDRTLESRFRAELDKVLNSEAFRHSESLSRLLTFLADRGLAGEKDGLKEYAIGVEAFGKPADYDPQQDPTVRVLASKLRHRLDDYYHKEGADDPVRLELPRGHYEVSFHLRDKQDPSLQPSLLRAQIRRWQRVSLALGIAAVLVLLGAGLLLRSSPEKEPVASKSLWTPELELIWRPFLESEHSILISLGTPMFAKMNGLFFRNPDINDWKTAQESEQVKSVQKELRSDYAVPVHPYTGIGEATGAVLLCRLLQTRRSDIAVKRGNILSWEDARQNNLIFLGPPKFNRLLDDLPEEAFVIVGGSIRNLRPGPGEKGVYRNIWSDNHMELLEDYALIYSLPGLHDHGRIMVLAGASTEATWAAVEYMTQPEHAREMVGRLPQPSGQLPPAYQVVVRAQFKAQVPFRISYLAHRVLEHPWQPKPVPSASTPQKSATPAPDKR